MTQQVPLTQRGHEALQSELSQLKSVDRPAVIEAIATARALGDLKENAEYHAAREQQGFIEGRISEIEDKLSRAQVIDVTALPQSGKVVFGVTVTLYDEEADRHAVYQLVGEDEADIKQGRLSINSPIARAIVGKELDDVVDIQTPGGLVTYEIEKIEYLG